MSAMLQRSYLYFCNVNLCRPTPNLGEPIRGGPPNSWHQMNQQNFGPSPNAAIQGFGGQLLSRSGDAAISLTPVRKSLVIRKPILLLENSIRFIYLFMTYVLKCKYAKIFNYTNFIFKANVILVKVFLKLSKTNS